MATMTWINAWNDIIRDHIFSDTELKTLMEIPTGTSIVDFIDRYFVRAGYSNTLLSNEAVRVVYSDIESDNTNVPGVRRCELSFDIYVKTTELHNYGNDRLLFRTQLIAHRLAQILMSERYINGYRFWNMGECDLGTRTTGYVRYNISFGYMRAY